jgi:hypothetical protein
MPTTHFGKTVEVKHGDKNYGEGWLDSRSMERQNKCKHIDENASSYSSKR